MGTTIYHVTQTPDEYMGYRVFVNGKEAPLNCARVSAVPFNRRWPGYQRQKSQTEMINFLSFATDEEVFIEVIPLSPFEDVVIRPLSLGIKPDVTDGKISFKLKRAAYFAIEPYGRNNALHIFADPVADYGIDIKSESIIYFPSGEHEAGMIELKSNQTLFIDEGAVVYGCVRAIDAENIRIVGRGILDNSHNKEQILFEARAENNFSAVRNAKRIRTIQLEYCTNVEIEGITIRDSLVYNIRPVACKDVHIHNVKIIGCWRYNSDGIDMHNCENVLIENCFIRTFDDAICVKGFDCFYDGDVEKAVREAMYRGGKSYDVFKNVLVRNCVLWNDWGKALEIGAETRANEIYDITFTDCDVIHLCSPALDCYNVDYADIHDVCYRNINVEANELIPPPILQKTDDGVYSISDTSYMPPIIMASVEYHEEYSAKGEKRGKIRNVSFENINIITDKKPKFSFKGYNNEYKTSDITLKDIHINGKKIADDSQYELEICDYCENIAVV